MGTKIFINYRRSANLKDAQLLHATLCRQFGQSRVFLDVSGLDGGDHWLPKLEKQVDASTVLLSLIGKNWAELTEENGQRRLDNPNDFVRFEIARALSREMPVLPVLVDGASMPDIARLPTNLVPLTFAQAMLLRKESFNEDAKRIADRLKLLLVVAGKRGIGPWKLGAMVTAALAVGGAAGHYLTTTSFPITLVEPFCSAAPETQQNETLSPVASFNCSAANLKPDESAICKNMDLRAMDFKLTSQYEKLRSSLDKQAFSVLKDQQVRWLNRMRLACGSDANCLSILYRCKLNELNLLVQNPG